DPLANTDTAEQEPATEPETDSSDEETLEADTDEAPLPLDTEPLEADIETPAPADSTATPLPMSQLPSEADMKVAQEILEQFKQLKEAGDLHHFSIYLRVLGGTAELSGELVSEEQHKLLVRTTRTVTGVEAVKDLLVIKDAKQEEATEEAIEQPLPPAPIADTETADPVLPLEPALEAAAETTTTEADAVAPVEPVEETAAKEAPAQEEEVNETPEPAAAVDEKPASDEPVDPAALPDPVEEELLQIK
ncbi:MAG: BON domain-containing protein, partial [Planctomycetaceae bacterium]|nr:BON domain-containing protein [Planctomycetaceae bacterium]